MQKKVLVVDNNKVILKLLTHILESKGCLVRTAENGLLALKTLQTYRPDVIFIDLIMPNIDGENLCRILREKPDFFSTVLVILSAVALEAEIDFVGFGADACIAKGPAREMGKYIELVMEYVERGAGHTLPKEILGSEHVFKRDITKELLEAKQNFEITLDNMDNGFVELSISGKIIYCNSLAARFLNSRVEELLSIDILNLFKGENYKYVSKCLNKLRDTQVVIEGEKSFKLGGRDLVCKFIPVLKKEERSIILLMQDVTKEKTANKKLKQHMQDLEKIVSKRTEQCKKANKKLRKKISERLKINEELEFVARQWSNTFDTITDFVSVHDKNMKFVRVNRTLASFIGKDPEDILGSYCYELIHNRDNPFPDCPHVRAIETGKTVSVEFDDPKIGFPLLVTCSPLFHDDGSLMGSVHIARDISQQKNAANERERLIHQLKDTLAHIKKLSGIIPICASCKKVRDDKGYWNQVEEYIRDHSEAEFSHSICPACANKLYPELKILKDEE